MFARRFSVVALVLVVGWWLPLLLAIEAWYVDYRHSRMSLWRCTMWEYRLFVTGCTNIWNGTLTRRWE